MEILVGLCIGLALTTVRPIARSIGEVRRRARARRRMLDGAHSVADRSLVTMTGTVRLIGEPLLAPLSGTACVAHRSRARMYAHNSSAFARRLIGEEARVASIPFALVTSDGELIVDGKHVELAIRPRAVQVREIAREIAFLREVGLTKDPANTSFDEVVIAAGMQITVHGIAQVETTAAAAGEVEYREAPSRTRLIGDEHHPLTISEA